MRLAKVAGYLDWAGTPKCETPTSCRSGGFSFQCDCDNHPRISDCLRSISFGDEPYGAPEIERYRKRIVRNVNNGDELPSLLTEFLQMFVSWSACNGCRVFPVPLFLFFLHLQKNAQQRKEFNGRLRMAGPTTRNAAPVARSGVSCSVSLRHSPENLKYLPRVRDGHGGADHHHQCGHARLVGHN